MNARRPTSGRKQAKADVAASGHIMKINFKNCIQNFIILPANLSFSASFPPIKFLRLFLSTLLPASRSFLLHPNPFCDKRTDERIEERSDDLE